MDGSGARVRRTRGASRTGYSCVLAGLRAAPHSPGSLPSHLLAETAVHALDDDAGGITVLPADPIALQRGNVGYGARWNL